MPALPLREPVGAALLASSGALIAAAFFFGGGDSSARLVWVGGTALVAAAVVTAAAFVRVVATPRIGRYGFACIACFAGLVVWQGISIVWSVQPDRSWDYVNRGVVYLAFLALGLFLSALVPQATRLAANVLAVLLALVIAYAFLAKGIPSLYPDYGRLARLRSPVGFWGALALLGDFALALGLWRAAERRVDGTLLVFGGVLTVLLAYSRGGVAIAVAVAALWLLLDERRLESLLALVIGGGGALAVFGVSLALPGVSDDHQAHATRAHDGRLFLLAVVVGAALVGGLAWSARRVSFTPVARRRATVALLAVAGAACVAGVAAAAVHSDRAANASPAGAYCTQGAGRLACGSSDERVDWWKQAWDMFERRPLGGTGAASFQIAHRLRRAEFTRPATEPHDFAVQMLGETGIVGFLLFAGAVAAGALSVRRRLRDDAAVALAVCALAYLGNILIDVGYDYVAVSAPFFTLLGVLLADGRREVARREPVWAFGTAALAGTAVLSLAAPYVSQLKVDDAVASGDPRLAAQAHSWNPVSIDPLLAEAALEESAGGKLKALRLYRKAVSTQPENPDAWVQLGLFELDGLKAPCSAFRELNHAYELDRYNPAVATHGGPLDVARAKAKQRGCSIASKNRG